MEQRTALAPCIAIVGPANSGKTTLLHFLDRALAARPSRPVTYVVKGNPDGTGRYLLFRTREERDALKERVKGKWAEPTVDTICQWIRNARGYLDIALLDFGGKRDPDARLANQRMLHECTHVIVLARRFDDPGVENEKGREAWRADCREAGLIEIAVIESLWAAGEPGWRDEDGLLRASIRADKDQPNETINAAVIDELAARIEALPHPGRIPAYVDLSREGGWDTLNSYSQIQAIAPRLRRLALSSGPVPLGGKTAIFIYLMAMHIALAANPETEVLMFNPTVAWGLVNIPRLTGQYHRRFPYDDLKVELTSAEDGLILDIRVVSKDKFLLPSAAQWLAYAPLPTTKLDNAKRVYINGVAPNWLHAAYSRWLATSGVTEILLMDKSSNSYIRVLGEPGK